MRCEFCDKKLENVKLPTKRFCDALCRSAKWREDQGLGVSKEAERRRRRQAAKRGARAGTPRVSYKELWQESQAELHLMAEELGIIEADSIAYGSSQ